MVPSIWEISRYPPYHKLGDLPFDVAISTCLPSTSPFRVIIFYIQMALGMVLLVSFLRVAGKWLRYLLITMLILELVVIAIITAMLVFLP